MLGQGELEGLLRVDFGMDRQVTSLGRGTPSDWTCARFEDGAVACWGGNSNGMLGLGDMERRADDGSELGEGLSITDLGTGRSVHAVSTGLHHACAILDNGEAKCWGDNAIYGMLGIGDRIPRGDDPEEMGDNLPAVALGGSRYAVSIAAGGFSGCALLDDGAIKCWGSNSVGQLGLGDTENRGDEPGEMGDALPSVDLGDEVVVAIAAGDLHTSVLLAPGEVRCWGDNEFGQLGLGDTENRGDEPGEMGDRLPSVELGQGVVATALAPGCFHTCVLLDTGQVKCWGANEDGQLGLGDTENRGDDPGEMGDNLPVVDLGPGRAAVEVAAGCTHTCARLDDDSVKCWGDNEFGKLGLGDTENRGDEPGEMGDNLPAVDLGE
jgi:alpha-tubulin suppressor-like RCC1 family protein